MHPVSRGASTVYNNLVKNLQVHEKQYKFLQHLKTLFEATTEKTKSYCRQNKTSSSHDSFESTQSTSTFKNDEQNKANERVNPTVKESLKNRNMSSPTNLFQVFSTMALPNQHSPTNLKFSLSGEEEVGCNNSFVERMVQAGLAKRSDLCSPDMPVTEDIQDLD